MKRTPIEQAARDRAYASRRRAFAEQTEANVSENTKRPGTSFTNAEHREHTLRMAELARTTESIRRQVEELQMTEKQTTERAAREPYTNLEFNALPGWARDHILLLESRTAALESGVVAALRAALDLAIQGYRATGSPHDGVWVPNEFIRAARAALALAAGEAESQPVANHDVTEKNNFC